MEILKKTLHSVLLVTILSICVVGCSGHSLCRHNIETIDKYIAMNGVIKDIYFDNTPGGRGSPTIELANGGHYTTSTFSLICYAQNGDSIIKKAGELMFLIKRKDSIRIFYPECGNWIITDSNEIYIGKQNYDCGKDLQKIR